MSRIATLTSSDQMTVILARTQQRVQDLQTQVATGKRAQSYAGIAGDTRRLIGLEAQRALLDRFEQNNALMATRLDATAVAVDGIGETVRDFRNTLRQELPSTSALTPAKAGELQQAAFRAMQGMQQFLNTDVDGRALFAGSRVRQQPVDIGAASLEAFQARWNGSSVVYPPTRQAQVGASGTLSHAQTGDLALTRSSPSSDFDTITAANTGAFAALEPGATITIADSTTGNDGTYTVVSSDGDRAITIAGTLSFPGSDATISVAGALADPAGAADTGARITIGNWYRGDTVARSFRLDEQRSFTLDLDGIDPAFEKAFRALGLIAQGAAGTAGGLDAHPERVEQALALLGDALGDLPATGDGGPFGAERKGSLPDVESLLGFQQVMLDDSKTLQGTLAATLDDRIAGIENANPTDVIARLLDATQSLQASYQAIATVRPLNLAQFL